MKKILLLSEKEAKKSLYCAYKGGHKVIVTGNLGSNKMIRFHPFTEKFIPLTNKLNFPERSAKLRDEIIKIIKQENIDVLLPSTFDCIRLISCYQNEFKKVVNVMPTPELETIDILDNKYNFFRFCEKNRLSHPSSYLLEKLELIQERKIPKLNYPIISKPLLGSGQKGLEVFQNEEELYDYYKTKKESERPPLPVLLQEYFEGEDIDFNGFAVNGEVKAWSVMRTTVYSKKPVFTMTDFIQYDEVGNLGKQIVKHSNYSGPLNIDMRIRADNGKVQLIEVNPRFWARIVYSLMDGINFIDVGIQNALNRNYSVQSKINGRQWVSNFSPLLKAIFKNRDKESYRFLKNLSLAQIRYMIFTHFFINFAKLKNKLSG